MPYNVLTTTLVVSMIAIVAMPVGGLLWLLLTRGRNSNKVSRTEDLVVKLVAGSTAAGMILVAVSFMLISNANGRAYNTTKDAYNQVQGGESVRIIAGSETLTIGGTPGTVPEGIVEAQIGETLWYLHTIWNPAGELGGGCWVGQWQDDNSDSLTANNVPAEYEDCDIVALLAKGYRPDGASGR